MANPVSEFFPAGRGGEVSDQAAAWFAYLRSGHDTEAGRAEFSAWLREDPSHAAAYKTIRDAWDSVAEIERVEERLTAADDGTRQEAPAPTAIPHSHSARQGWRMAAAAMVLLTLGGGLAAGALYRALNPASDAVQIAAEVETLYFETGIGEVETVSLPDGSVITLSGNTHIQARLGDIREVILNTGQAYFEVAHDSAHPFEVRAGAAEVRVVGTAFDIRHGADAVAVSVTEGRVRLTSATATGEESALSMLLIPRQQAVLSDDGGVRRGSFDADHTLAWRQRRFYFEDASLCDLVIDVNRFSETPVRAAGPDACEMRVSASFDSEQIDQALEAVAHSLGLTLERNSGEIRLVSAEG